MSELQSQALRDAIVDRVLIRERMAAYADAPFRADVDAYLACWADDCIRIGNGEEVRGKSGLRKQWDGIWKFLEKMTFFTEVCDIAIDGDRATARCYCREILVRKGGGVRKVVGRYDDKLVRDGGAWLFSRWVYDLFLDEGTAKPG